MTRLAAFLAATLAVPASAATFNYARTIANPVPANADFFGSAVAIGNGTLLVGARFDDPGATTNAGSAYAFDLASGALVATFTAPAPVAGDALGSAVAADGATLVVAAPEASAHAGVVYRFPGAHAYLTATTGAKLGSAVAVSGGVLVAGAPYEDGTGAAHLFDVASGAHLRAIPNPTPDPDDLFGRAVALAGGDVVAVGAPSDDAPAANAGVVHLFTRTTGALRTTLTAPQPKPGDNFGAALAADGNLLAVGAPYTDSAGVVYVFDVTTGTLVKTLTSPATDARFGAAVAISAGRVLVGAPFADGAATDAGAAYVYDLSGTLLDTLTSPAAHAGDQFGSAVALVGSTAAVGAWLDDTGVDNAGAVYQFVDVSVPTTSSTSTSSTTSTSTSVTTTTSTSVTTTTTETTTSSEAPPASITTTTVTETSAVPPTSSFTTTTAVTSGGSQRTTTTLVSCDTGCDDGDPCSVDACASDVCVHETIAGFDGVVCRLDVVDATLHGPPLASKGVTTRLQRKLARARRLVELARQKPAPRAVRRAGKALAVFIATLKRAQRTGRMAYAVAEGLVSLSTQAATQLGPLR